ncbi:MAG TPA: ferredoxin reductase family protein [Gaiellaceae bacterium]
MTTYENAIAPARKGRFPGIRARTPWELIGGIVFWVVVIGVGIYWVVIWAQGGSDGLSGFKWQDAHQIFLNVGRITALLGGYLAIVEVLLLARLPFLERWFGFDRLTIWHKWNGHAVLYLILAHVVFSVWGDARDPFLGGGSWSNEYWNLMVQPLYPGIIIATIGTVLLIFVVFSSLAIARRKLNYELWYAVHFTAYAGIALAWFHEIPAGNELTPNVEVIPADIWRATYAAALLLVVWYRLGWPIVQNWRYRLRISEVVEEAPGIWSLRISGRGLERYHAKAGQFFFWRFLTHGFWYTQHPFSVSEAPHGDSFRITVKALGDHTGKFGQLKVGTRVLAEGPFGVFTADTRTRAKVLMIAGGIGITPVRALLEEFKGDVITIYRALTERDLVLSGEIDQLVARNGGKVDYVVGDHTTPEGARLLTPEHLRELVPDIDERDVYACGPPAMLAVIEQNLHKMHLDHSHVHIENFAI